MSYFEHGLSGDGMVQGADPMEAMPITDMARVGAGEDAVEQATVERVATLTGIVDELAGLCTALSERARNYVREGGSIDRALAEINDLRPIQEPASDIDQRLTEARNEYADILTKRRRLFHPGRKASLQTAQEGYKEALTTKIEATTDLHSDSDGDGLTVEALVERGLSVLTSTLLAEEETLRETVGTSKQSTLMNRLVSSPVLYRSVLAGLVTSSIAIRSGLIPAEGDTESIMHTTELGIEGVAAFGFASVGQEKLFRRANSRWAARQLLRSETAIREDESVADDLIERAVGGVGDQNAEPTGARLLASRLFSNHLEELKHMDKAEPESVDVQYAKMIHQIVAEEVKRSMHGIVSGEKHTTLFRGLSIIGAFIAGPIIANVGVSVAATNDLEDSLKKNF